MVSEIRACYDCPIFNEDYGYCQDGARIKHPITENVFPDDCGLEEYQDVTGKSITELRKMVIEKLIDAGCSQDVAEDATDNAFNRIISNI